ncbi:MAG: polyprenol monophosphomannose synthase [bacterium]
MIPTYNESLNIQSLIKDVLAVDKRMEVVVVDDNSPDGTWNIVAQMGQGDPRVHLVRRMNERGRGSAGVAGFLYALDHGADYIVEMDADYSHHPRFLPAMLKAAFDGAQVVIGSRLVAGGGEIGRSKVRAGITWLANLYIRLVLHLPIRDCTSGYRIYHRDALRRVPLARMTSNGPAIVQEVLQSCAAARCTFAEVPIQFEERQRGESTFSLKILLSGLFSVIKFRIRGPVK